jgi:hypothetical protein
MLGEAHKVVIIDEVHMMFDGGRGDLVNEIVCLCRFLRIPVLVLTGTLQRGEWRRLAIRLFYRVHVYPCIQNRLATTNIAYARPPTVDYCELIGSRKRKYPQIRRTFAKGTWHRLLVMFGIYTLTHDDPDGVIVFGHTKAAMEELFMKFVDFVQQNKAVCDRIIKREPLPLAALPVEAYAAFPLEKLYEAVALGHTLRIAYNHAGVGDVYSETVGDEVTRHQSGAYPVIVCTSTYVAGINIRNVNYVFINGDREQVPHGRVYRPSELTQMAGQVPGGTRHPVLSLFHIRQSVRAVVRNAGCQREEAGRLQAARQFDAFSRAKL